MALPELMRRQAVKRLDDLCALQAKHHLHPRKLIYQIEGQQVNLFEIRSCLQSPQQQKIPIAQVRFSAQLNQWTLHHQNGEHWQLYLNANPTLDLGKLLSVIQQDPFGYFWVE